MNSNDSNDNNDNIDARALAVLQAVEAWYFLRSRADEQAGFAAPTSALHDAVVAWAAAGFPV